MNQKSFWTYTLLSLLLTSIAVFIVGATFRPDKPAVFDEYQEYVNRRTTLETQRTQWLADHAVEMEYRDFEEALAGIRPIHTLHAQYQQPAQELIRLLKGKDADTIRTVQILSAAPDLNITQDQGQILALRSQTKMRLPNSEMSNAVVKVILGDPHRAARIFAGDVEAIPAWLPRDIPDEFSSLNEPISPGPAEVSRPLFSTLPVFPRFSYWIAVSTFFALCFTAIGLLIPTKYDDQWPNERKKKESWSHPLTTFPGFVMGWMVYAAAAPGFILLQILRLMNLNVTGSFQVWRRKRRLTHLKFHELQKIALETLTDIRSELADTEGSKDLQGIDRLIKEVQRSSNAEHVLRVAEAVNGYQKEIHDRQVALREINELLHSDDRADTAVVG